MPSGRSGGVQPSLKAGWLLRRPRRPPRRASPWRSVTLRCQEQDEAPPQEARHCMQQTQCVYALFTATDMLLRYSTEFA